MVRGVVIAIITMLLMTGCTSNIVIERDAAVTVPQETNVCSETGCTTAETDRGNLKQDKENADKRLDVFMKRLEVSDVHLEVMSLTSKIDSDVVTTSETRGVYYTNQVALNYKDNNSDISFIKLGKTGYLLDNITEVAYSVNVDELSCIDGKDILGCPRTKGVYYGTGKEVIDKVELLSDYYTVGATLYTFYYDKNNNLIGVGERTNDCEVYNVIKTFTTVQSAEWFEVPDNYTILDYESYLEVICGETNKFSALLKETDKD